MLRQRVITAMILSPMVVAGVIYLPTLVLAVIFAAIICVAAWEWCACIGIKHHFYQAIYIFFVLCCSMVCLYLLEQPWLFLVILCGFLWWHIAILLVIYYQRNVNISLSSIPLKALIGVLVLVPCWLSLVLIHNHTSDQGLLLFLLFLVWLADSSAYFAGKKLAKKKLASNVSPGKSWEGVYAALFISFLLGCAYVLCRDMQFIRAVFFILLTLLTVIFSVFGDLLESMFKRIAGINDSGYILPGHGGLLDRIDSLTAAAPVFCAGLWFMDRLL